MGVTSKLYVIEEYDCVNDVQAWLCVGPIMKTIT